MSAWRSLFSLAARHAYYDAPSQVGLVFSPSVPTARWLRRAGCLLQTQEGLLRVLHDGSPLPAHEDGASAALVFLAVARDPLFHNITDGLPRAADSMPVFAADAPDQGAAAVPLRRVLDMPRGLSGAPHPGPLPCLAVRLPVPRGPASPGTTYELALASRSTVWKYLLVGDWRIDRLQVVDLASEVQFDDPQTESLADGSPALAIRSRQHIAMHERAPYRFQLRGRRESAARPQQQVLVKRLPLADARQFALESRAGTPALVSEILVHR